ncbi:MAG: hypothetical protein JWM21_3552 [Acidobacteria bacterium]|nr:hypothetical protein [Acidobacteriota bacterium]
MTPKLSDYGSQFARLVLRCIRREYPNKLDHVLADASQVKNPRALHPAFYGCFDWHSSVHGHWLLAHLLRLFANLPEAFEIRAALNENLTAESLLTEAHYFQQRDRDSFERMYGWTWLLKLAEELSLSSDAEVARWSQNLTPLVDAVVERYLTFLPKQLYPIRTGVHPNTAFGLSFALDYARTTEHQELTELIEERSRTYFLSDADYAAAWEPSGEDFLSPALVEADLMRRVLSPAAFRDWFKGFVPQLENGEPRNLFVPVTVSDRTDGKLVHLDGLNLSRAWCMQSIAANLSPGDEAVIRLTNSALLHAQAGLASVSSGHYEGEHWLATFAVYLLSTGFPL